MWSRYSGGMNMQWVLPGPWGGTPGSSAASPGNYNYIKSFIAVM